MFLPKLPDFVARKTFGNFFYRLIQTPSFGHNNMAVKCPDSALNYPVETQP